MPRWKKKFKFEISGADLSTKLFFQRQAARFCKQDNGKMLTFIDQTLEH